MPRFVFEEPTLNDLLEAESPSPRRFTFDEATVATAPATSTPPNSPNILQDVGNSVLFRGIPEGVAASTTGGLGLNATHLIADATRAIGGKIYKAAKGEDLPHYTANPIPTSSDIINKVASGLPETVKTAIGATDRGLYEPRTIPGEYGNTIAQFGAGGLASGIPLNQSIPTAVVSETAGQLTKGTKYEPAARIGTAALTPLAISGGNYALNKLKASPQTSDELRKAASPLFDKFTKSGGIYSNKLTDEIADLADASRAQGIAGQTKAADEALNKALDFYSGLRGKNLTAAEIQKLDQSFADDIARFNRAGEYNFGRILNNIKYEFRNRAYDPTNAANYINSGNPQAVQDLLEANRLWQQSYKAKDVERILLKAQGTENPQTSIRTGLKNLLANENKMASYTKAEQAILRQAMKRGIAGGTIKLFGGRLIDALLGGGLGFSAGGPAGAIVGAAAGKVAGGAMADAAGGIQANRLRGALQKIQGKNNVVRSVPIQQQIPYQPNVPLLFGLGAGVRQ